MMTMMSSSGNGDVGVPLFEDAASASPNNNDHISLLGTFKAQNDFKESGGSSSQEQSHSEKVDPDEEKVVATSSSRSRPII
jgi:hypothetical protein